MIPISITDTVYGPMLVLETDKNQAGSLMQYGKACVQWGDDALVDLLLKKLDDMNDSPVFVDVGGCLGVFTIGLSQKIEEKGGKTYCFEPQRILYNCICGSIALNGLERTHCINKVVGNPNGPKTLSSISREAAKLRAKVKVPKFNYSQDCNFGSVEFGGKQHEPLDQQRDYSSEEEMIDVTSLDSYINEFGKVDLMKIDVEGMEMDVLAGATQIFKTFHPTVLIEWIKSDKNKMVDFFRGLGYKSVVETKDISGCHPMSGEFLCEY
jgi:FkbM family methyltransferase